MLVFIDESGDAGLKFEAGSSSYFVVCMITFECNETANLVDAKISSLRNTTPLHLHKYYEFKFNKANREIRELFLNAVKPYQFGYYAIVIDKKKLTGKGFRIKESFYKFTCQLLFSNAKSYLREAIVVIDGSGSREFRRELETYIRRKLSEMSSHSYPIKKIKVQDSESNNLVQMADMVCGAISRQWSGKPDACDYYRIISAHEKHLQVWPKTKNPTLSS